MTDYAEVLYEVDDPVAVVTLNRPAALNAMTPLMQAELHDALLRAQHDPAVVGIVVTGAGRGFSAGADMNMLARLSERRSVPIPELAGDRSWGPDFGGLFTSVLSIPKPVIGAINGAVAGMSVGLALACDLRFMAPDAKFTMAFSERGLIAEWGVSWMLPRLVGPANALDLLLSSRVVLGDEAQRMGLVNRVIAPDEGTVVDAARAYIGQLAQKCSPTSLGLMKRQIYQQLHRDGLGQADSEANRMMVESFARPDFTEGVQAFLQKRPSTFARVAGFPVEKSTPASD
jgi:enoyl-CoA hydratase/carnithine racemase